MADDIKNGLKQTAEALKPDAKVVSEIIMSVNNGTVARDAIASSSEEFKNAMENKARDLNKVVDRATANRSVEKGLEAQAKQEIDTTPTFKKSSK